MIGENFEIYTSEMAKNALKILYHGWRNFWNLHFWNVWMHIKSSTMVGEIFENYPSEMAKNVIFLNMYGSIQCVCRWRKQNIEMSDKDYHYGQLVRISLQTSCHGDTVK